MAKGSTEIYWLVQRGSVVINKLRTPMLQTRDHPATRWTTWRRQKENAHPLAPDRTDADSPSKRPEIDRSKLKTITTPVKAGGAVCPSSAASHCWSPEQDNNCRFWDWVCKAKDETSSRQMPEKKNFFYFNISYPFHNLLTSATR